MSDIRTVLQGSFDRQDETIKRKLANEFLSGYMGGQINPADIELPPDSDPRKADFVYKGELFQVVIPNQEAAEKDVLPESPVQSLQKQRGDVSKVLKGKADNVGIVGGDPIEDVAHTIKEKFEKYGDNSKTLILIVEFPDLYEELFYSQFAPHREEIKKRTDAAGITFKEIWLVRRKIVNDQPTYAEQIKLA